MGNRTCIKVTLIFLAITNNKESWLRDKNKICKLLVIWLWKIILLKNHLWSLCSNINVMDTHIFTTEPDVVRSCQVFCVNLSKEEVVLQYKNLWMIERVFQRLKDILEVRPIYHQIDRRIKGHVFISFLALYLEMCLRKRLQGYGLSSLDNSLRAIRQIKAVKIRIKQKAAILRTELPEEVHRIFQALNIRPPNRIIEQWEKG